MHRAASDRADCCLQIYATVIDEVVGSSVVFFTWPLCGLVLEDGGDKGAKEGWMAGARCLKASQPTFMWVTFGDFRRNSCSSSRSRNVI